MCVVWWMKLWCVCCLVDMVVVYVVRWPLTKRCCVVCSYAETPSYGDYSTVESQVVELKVRLRGKKLDLAAIRGKVRGRGGEGRERSLCVNIM